jgi:hypothetical protein
MDEEIKQRFTDVMIHIEATKLLVRETLAIVVSQHSDPDDTLKSMRKAIEKITEIVETATISGDHAPEFRKWFAEQVRKIAIAQLAPVQQRAIGLKTERTTH